MPSKQNPSSLFMDSLEYLHTLAEELNTAAQSRKVTASLRGAFRRALRTRGIELWCYIPPKPLCLLRRRCSPARWSEHRSFRRFTWSPRKKAQSLEYKIICRLSGKRRGGNWYPLFKQRYQQLWSAQKSFARLTAVISNGFSLALFFPLGSVILFVGSLGFISKVSETQNHEAEEPGSFFFFFLKAGRRGSNLLDKNVVFNGEHAQGKAPSQNNPFMFKTFIFQASLSQTPPPFL